MADHMHMMISIPSKFDISQAVGYILRLIGHPSPIL